MTVSTTARQHTQFSATQFRRFMTVSTTARQQTTVFSYTNPIHIRISYNADIPLNHILILSFDQVLTISPSVPPRPTYQNFVSVLCAKNVSTKALTFSEKYELWSFLIHFLHPHASSPLSTDCSKTISVYSDFNPHPANVENMVNS